MIFGVKEVPIENLMENKTYFMFSHTIKAQSYNMPLLDKFLEKKLRIVDFECIREDKPENAQRLVAFGRYAGIAGAFDFIRGCGEFLLQKGFQTPLVFLGSSYMYEDFSAMKDALRRISVNIEKGGLPKAHSPMVFAVTGTGRVSQGILEVLKELPHEFVQPDDLESFIEKNQDNKQACKKIVISVFSAEHLVELKEPTDEPFNKKHYYDEPGLYHSKFHKYLPYVSWLINGIYWEPKYPRVLTKKDLIRAKDLGKLRLMGVSDISADYDGSIEFTSEFTSIEEPFLVWDIYGREFRRKVAEADENCILFHSVDHLPAEMPKEASNHFGAQLCRFVESICNSPISSSLEQQQKELPPEIFNAILCCHGNLTPNYQYIARLRKKNEEIDAYMRNEKEKHAKKGLGLKRNMSLLTFQLIGHLFDTHCFNRAIDACEQQEVQFRVLNLELGLTEQSPSKVAIQIMCKDKDSLNAALDSICQIAE